MLERIARESRSGAELPSIFPAPVENSVASAESPSRSESGNHTSADDRLPEGYSLGTYRGIMQRAPRTNVSGPEPAPNPAWLDLGSAQDAILDQAARNGRRFTFVVLRLSPGTDLQALNRALTALGSRIEGSTGPYVRVRFAGEPSHLPIIAGLDGVLGIGTVPPEQKANAAFVQELMSRPASESAPAYITLMAEDPAGEWRRALTELGVVVGAYDRELRSYTASVPAATLANVIGSDFVLSVEPIPMVTANLASSVPAMGVDGLRQYDPVRQQFTGFTGSGIAVGVLDSGLNTNHIDIASGRSSICGANFVTHRDYEIWDLWMDLGGHGTHVVGTIAGAGRVDPVLAGIAPALSHLRVGKVLTAWGGGGTGDDVRRGMDFLARSTSCLWRGAQSAAVKPLIVNMSLAATALTFSGRGLGERKLDSIVRGHSQLYVVAQANSAQHGFSNYGTAKNSLAVGAVEDSGIIADFSSHGPTADGRLAPNVVATGRRITSARGAASVSGHTTVSGTSTAAPSVSGVAALLMEARPEFQNRPALTRARLMASAIRPQAYLKSHEQLPTDNTDGPGAFNNQYGLGLVSARTTLFSHDDPEGWIVGSASSEPYNDSYEYIDIEVPEDASQLEIVLTWDEQPADTLTRSVLNNLDLWVDHAADCGADACGEHASRSEIDNVEWLLIENPASGPYRIKVVPVEIYGESSSAAVAWKILRGSPVPQLQVEIEDTSASDESEFITLDVTVKANSYVASGTTVRLVCLNGDDCGSLAWAYEPQRRRVYRQDGLQLIDPRFTSFASEIGEVAADAPRRVQLLFRRAWVPQNASLNVVASAWNASTATANLEFGTGATKSDDDFVAPANDNFDESELIEGATGRAPVDLSRASREPGEPLVSIFSSTLWYTWQAPADGLFRFRLQNAESGDPADASFVLFTGSSVADLDVEVEKTGKEISWAAQAGTVYRLRIASREWDMSPMILRWESADSRPANDDFAYAQVIEGENGSIESTNQGATLENFEFQGGAAATVWFEWTAPSDGWWQFQTSGFGLRTNVFVGERVDGVRLVSVPDATAAFLARQGETYRIAVFARSADESGSRFTLSWNSTPLHHQLAENDLFGAAIAIEGAEGFVDEVVLENEHVWKFYTVEPREPAATGIGTGWWRWTAPSDGQYTWRMDGKSSYQLTFFEGDALENLEFLGSLSGGTAFVLDATGDSQYWIAFGRAAAYTGVQYGPPTAFTWGRTPVNDERAAATLVSGATGSARVELAFATRASNDPTNTVGTDSVWWRWRAPASGWQRFWVEDHPLSTILAIYHDSASVLAIADSERTFVANGRVEVHLLARAGQTYEIRISSRPLVSKEPSAMLRWEISGAPIALAYNGAVEIESIASNAVSQNFRSPRNLAMSDDGSYLFSSSSGGVGAFARNAKTGEVALTYPSPVWPGTRADAPDHLQQAFLWWNSDHGRLLAHPVGTSYSFALPEDGSSLLTRDEISVRSDDDFVFGGAAYPGVGSPDGLHFYAVNRSEELLRAYRFDSPTLLSEVQTITSRHVSGHDALIVPGIGRAVDMTFSSNGQILYVLTNAGLLVFARDASSGELELARESLAEGSPGNPLQTLREFKNVSLGGNGAILFVSGKPTDNFYSFGAGIAAFDISGDPADPTYLDTISGFFYHNSPDTVFVPSHMRSTQGGLLRCWNLVPHTGQSAVDVFCERGFYVVAWNAATNALEVTDFAVAGAQDRFGNTLPYHLGGDRRQMAQSPDGAHVYRVTRLERNEYSNAIHIYRRASSMMADESGEAIDGAVSKPTDPANGFR